MTKHLSHLLIIFLATINLQAQNITVEAPPGYNFINNKESFPKGTTEGSPYLDDWQLSKIILNDGKIISGLMIRYNVYTNQMQYQDNNKTYIIGTPDSISEIKFPSHNFLYKEYTTNKKIDKSYFEIVVKGKVNLLNKYEIEVIPSKYYVAMDVGDKNDRLVLKQQLYLHQGEMIVILNKKKDLLKVLNDRSKEISSYIDKEGLSCKKKEDMSKVLTYYNQLQ